MDAATPRIIADAGSSATSSPVFDFIANHKEGCIFIGIVLILLVILYSKAWSVRRKLKQTKRQNRRMINVLEKVTTDVIMPTQNLIAADIINYYEKLETLVAEEEKAELDRIEGHNEKMLEIENSRFQETELHACSSSDPDYYEEDDGEWTMQKSDDFDEPDTTCNVETIEIPESVVPSPKTIKPVIDDQESIAQRTALVHYDSKTSRLPSDNGSALSSQKKPRFSRSTTINSKASNRLSAKF